MFLFALIMFIALLGSLIGILNAKDKTAPFAVFIISIITLFLILH